MKTERNIFRHGNHVYFYDIIDDESSVILIERLLDADSEINANCNHIYNEPLPSIWLHICSAGGFVFNSFAIIDQIKLLRSPVISIIEGFVASGATVISMGCKVRFITPNSFVMIHQISSAVWGTVSEIEDEAFLGDMLTSQLVEFYKHHSNMRRKNIRKLMRRNSWFDAKTSVSMGFADEILLPDGDPT